MNRCRIFAYFVLLPALLSACAGRSAVISQMNRYAPPPVYAAPVASAVPSASAPERLPSPPSIDWPALKEKWEKKISDPLPETVFYTPDASRLEALSPAISGDAACEAALGDGFSLETLEILAWGRNPLVLSAGHTLKATLEAYSQAENLEEILRQYGAFSAGLMTGVSAMGNMEGIEKKYPFPGIISLKGDIVTQEVRIAREDFEISRRNAVTQARKAFWDLWVTRRAIDITASNLALLKTLESSTARRYETGDAPVRELSAVSVQKQKLMEDLTTLQEEKRNNETKIRSLLNLPETAKIGTPKAENIGKQLPSPEKLSALAGERRQELRKKRAMIARMELMIEMSETEIYPGFTQNLSLTENRAVNQAGTMKMTEPFAVTLEAGIGAGLPKNAGFGLTETYLRETRQKLTALRRELSGDEAQTTAQVREAWVSADRARRMYLLFKDRITAFSTLDFSVSSKAVETGAIPFPEFISTAAALFETRLSVEKSAGDLGRAIADLKEITGVSW
jgi:outer membrane protein, heavy metal efflux system